MSSNRPSIIASRVMSELIRLRKDERGVTAILFGIAFLAVLLVAGAAIDYSYEVQVKYQLDLAADAGALAATQYWAAGAELAANCTEYTAAVAAAQQAGAQAFNAQAGSLAGNTTPTVVVTPTPSTSDCSSQFNGSPAGAKATSKVTYVTTLNTFFMRLNFTAPGGGTVPGQPTVSVGNSSTANITLSPYANVYLVVDTSASMAVGSTAEDIYKVNNWVVQYGCAPPKGFSQVFRTCPAPAGQQTDVPPCGFACHDNTPLQPSDMQQGEDVAHSVGALTRFDVMKLALTNDPSSSYSQTYVSSFGEGLLPYIRDTYDTPQSAVNLDTFSYYLYGFNTDIGTNTENDNSPPVACGSTCSQLAVKAVPNSQKGVLANDIYQQLSIGFETHLNDTVLPKLVATGANALIGAAGNGSSVSSPIKFIILVTDGLNSDRSGNRGNPGTFLVQHQCATYRVTAEIPPFQQVNANECFTGNGTQQLTQVWGNNYQQYELSNCATNGLPSSPPGTSLCGWVPDNATVGSAGPIDMSYTPGNWPIGQSTNMCNAMKNQNNVILAILETPYVPLIGQTPRYLSYEETVQSSIYPQGPSASYDIGSYGPTSSAVSAALYNCASNIGTTSSKYYYQAKSSSEIATGFETLFSEFIGSYAYLSQ